ncbi:MAG: YgjV family protein [Ruminococcaceae bacterium]|nr:YgjV family protein [Oscillospiraceae bacterium]
MNCFETISPALLISQLFGAVGIFISITIYAGKNRSNIITCKFISDIVWAVNYTLIGAYTGALLNVIAMARETVFYNRGKKKWASSRLWLYVFILLVLISPAIDLMKPGVFSIAPLFPAVGSTFAVLSFYCLNEKRMRLLGLIAQLLWLVYGFFPFNPTGIISCSLTIVSIIIGALRAHKDKTADADTVNIDQKGEKK